MSRPYIKISLLSSIFICLTAVFLMSHNVSAYSASGVYGLSSGYFHLAAAGRQYFTVRDNNSLSFSNTFGPGDDLTQICFNTNAGIPKTHYMSFVVRLGATFGSSFGGFSSDPNWAIVSQNITSTSDGQGTLISVVGFNNGGNNASFCLNPSNGQYIAYHGGSTSVRLSIQISPVSWYVDVPYYEILNDINNNIQNIDIPSAQENADAIADEQEQRTQDTVDNSQDTADSSQEDTDETGTSLLSVFTSVIGVIVNSQETSCTFDSHLPFMSGSGTIDLCMFNPPAVVQTIASLLALALFVPFGLHMYKRFISITRSFQK